MNSQVEPPVDPPKSEFVKELEQLINKHCLENLSGTPDFLLAQYLEGQLKLFSDTMLLRDKWHGNSSLCMISAFGHPVA